MTNAAPHPVPEHYLVYALTHSGAQYVLESLYETEDELINAVWEQDAMIARIIHIVPGAEMSVDVTERILEKMGDASIDEEDLLPRCIRDLLDKWKLEYFTGHDDGNRYGHPDYEEHNTLNRVQQLFGRAHP